MNNYKDLIARFQGQKILLVGDIMLDRFVYGDVTRISPEGPIPILSATREDKMLGGAGNVFANLQAMGCICQIICRVGQDEAAKEVIDLVKNHKGQIQGIIQDAESATVLKTRFLSQNQQLLRVDQESKLVMSKTVQESLLTQAEEFIKESKVLILSDYGKGTLLPETISKLIKLAQKNKIPVVVDPKAKDYSVYKGSTIVTPNRKELSDATQGMAVKSDEDIEKAAHVLIKQSGIENVIATRSEDGMSVVSKKGKPVHLKTQAQEIFDVSGAGDTVVAAIAASIAAGATLEEAGHIGNIAGGLAVAKVGTAIIRDQEMMAALEKSQSKQTIEKTHGIAAIAGEAQAKEKIREWQARGLKVGFTNGCFDILHYGHVNYLHQAREKCDRLVVGINHDQSVKILKGENRPINDQMARATVIAALGSVDLVVFFGAEKTGEDNTPCALVGSLKPDILMKGGDYTIDDLPEGRVVLSYGGEVEIMPLYDGYSTTNIIAKSASK
ncbi:MAG: D-glycero-beta-D-manno-heptose-7-phosphate kinase [Alphaproteobacteria bacterium]|nr:D-glycero-beta-D-manno-heptose-7-phosphate kinase [Alphaproteobacteria bacterium]